MDPMTITAIGSAVSGIVFQVLEEAKAAKKAKREKRIADEKMRVALGGLSILRSHIRSGLSYLAYDPKTPEGQEFFQYMTDLKLKKAKRFDPQINTVEPWKPPYTRTDIDSMIQDERALSEALGVPSIFPGSSASVSTLVLLGLALLGLNM